MSEICEGRHYADIPAMTEKMVGEGSQYAGAFVDAKGNPLDGGKSYRLHMPPNIPIKNFWSFTVYDNQTRSMLQTDQQFPAVGSLTKGLLVNADGSVDVYFGPKAPVGKENNWVQTIPGKGWQQCRLLADSVAKLESCTAANFWRKNEAGINRRFE